MPDTAALARLHAACFVTPRPWSEAEISALLQSPHVFVVHESVGFALGQVVADEAEVLTIAVDPSARRQGAGARLLSQLMAAAKDHGAATCFLEVAATNQPALALYQTAGFAQSGRRRGYYTLPDGQKCDALILSRLL